MFVAVVAVASVVPVSLLVSMVRRVATRAVDCCRDHERQTSKFCLGPPRVERVDRFDNEGRKSIMEIVYSRCADGCVQTGREGLRSRRWAGSRQNRGDGAHLGLDCRGTTSRVG